MAERLRKEDEPNLYCRVKRCLWRLSSGRCPKHADAPENHTPDAREGQDQADHEHALDSLPFQDGEL